MGNYAKILQKVVSGNADQNLDFKAIRQLIIQLGFKERIRGDHFIYWREDIEEIINLQPKNGQAKPYQVQQLRKIIIRYRLGVNHAD